MIAGAFLIGFILGVVATIVAIWFYKTRLKKKIDEIKLKVELNELDKRK